MSHIGCVFICVTFTCTMLILYSQYDLTREKSTQNQKIKANNPSSWVRKIRLGHLWEERTWNVPHQSNSHWKFVFCFNWTVKCLKSQKKQVISYLSVIHGRARNNKIFREVGMVSNQFQLKVKNCLQFHTKTLANSKKNELATTQNGPPFISRPVGVFPVYFNRKISRKNFSIELFFKNERRRNTLLR